MAEKNFSICHGLLISEAQFVMKNALTIQATLIALLLWSTIAAAQASRTQQLLVLRVPELNSVSLAAGMVTVLIPGRAENHAAPPDGQVKLLWTVTGENRKITVAIDRNPVRPALRLIPQDITPGAAVAQVEMAPLAQEPHDFLVDVSRSAGSCLIRFDAAGGSPRDAEPTMHLVTYTVTGG